MFHARKIIIAGVLSAILLSLGCADTIKAPIQPRQDPDIPAQIHMTSMDLRRHTAVGTPLLTRDDAGILFVTVPVRAATDLKLYVDYRVTFFDRTGSPIHQTTWIAKTLPPNTPDQITVNSTTARATDFQMDIRYSE